MVIVVMGVTGSGKTTIGSMLAARLASLAQDSPGSGSDSSLRQQAQIIHALSAVFEEGQ